MLAFASVASRSLVVNPWSTTLFDRVTGSHRSRRARRARRARRIELEATLWAVYPLGVYGGLTISLAEGIDMDAQHAHEPEAGVGREVDADEGPAAVRALSPSAGWLVVGAAVTGLMATYWDDGWHTEVGRDSTFIPPHLLLYGSMAVIGTVLAVWVLRVLVARRSLSAVFATPGLALTAVAGATVAGAAPIDAAWHAEFGRDAVLWSPPHLVSVIGTVALVVGAMVGIAAPRAHAVRVGLAVALLGGSQLVLLEYDTDVPQFSELLYLPLLLLTGLSAAWVIRSSIGLRFDVTWVVGGYLLVRAAILGALSAAGWPAPDWPLPLLGLLVLNGPARWGAARWPLAGLTMTVLQLAASASGMSSVGLGPLTAGATLVTPVLVVAVIATTAWRRGAAVAGVALMVMAAPFPNAPRAQAHDPGQGPEQGTAELMVVGNGNGVLLVTAEGLDGLAGGVEPVRLVARRADRVVTSDLRRGGSADADESFTGDVVLPEPGRWFVYVELRQQGQVLEAWLPVEQNMNATTLERRPVYLPAGTGPRPAGEYALGAGLLGIGLMLTVWSAVAVERYRRARPGSIGP